MEAFWFWKPAPHGLAGSSPATPTKFTSAESTTPALDPLRWATATEGVKNLSERFKTLYAVNRNGWAGL